MSGNNLAEPLHAYFNDPLEADPVVIVGNGPVGIKAAQLLVAKSQDSKIVIFGEEREAPYNRVQLSQYLAGKVSEAELDNPLKIEDHSRVEQKLGHKIIAVDRQLKTVTDDQGNVTPYSKLILATGSQPVVPAIANVDLEGVYTFRTLNDTKSLINERSSASKLYVIGSGPLGLETAVAMKQPNNEVKLEVRSNLLNRDLGEQAQEVLSDYVKASGIEIVHHNPLAAIIGDSHIEQIELQNGERIDCDCLIICAGVKPSTFLAEKIGLETRKGIVVDEKMRTSDPDVYAIGECCEFDDMTFGIVSPGFSQAKTCVEHITGNFHSYFNENIHVQVKFNDYTTGYFGELLAEGSLNYTYVNRLKGVYRKLVVKNNLLIGAIIIGNWDEENEIKIAVKQKKKLTEKALREFEITGLIHQKPKQKLVEHLPRDYIVCLCEGVTRGELSRAITSGCRTVESLGEKTCAGTVCGSCKPMLMNLLDAPAPNLVMRHQKSILSASILSIILIIATVFFQPLSIAESVQFSWHIEKLWFDNFWKQVSGYSLLGLCVFASALAIRKRFKKFRVGHVDSWRYAHSIVGILALVMLMVHTGMRLGDNLNFALMAVFLGATLTGSLVGVFMARNHHWSDFKLRKHRLWWSRIHHTLLWMLPPLLGFHILSVYYF
ncbi:NAD(P)/FAD-dependent oxidoreductase [Aliikangiella marina]|uniref:NAD(P)/FAD-dependent oxidoreductase n=1 Tax=Aliikangiella marina TaxID=1712262 RepID=A0A545T9Z4_9GAMM|nr:FAD-dependent oxidoreductase [Aliikangiella marina]TQV74024.1 NAD(P)/FAD-dependent oxidoreductase [Aliikangiella marina]